MATPNVQGQPPRTTAELARHLFQLVRERNLEGVLDLQHADVEEDFLVLRTLHGKDEVRRFFAGLFAAFPDFDLAIERVTSEGNTAVVQWTSRGTFSGGPFEGIDPNGKHVSIRGVDVMEFDGGKLRRNTIYYDGMSFARQVGLLPAQQSGAEKAMTAAFNVSTRARKLLGL